MKAHTLSEDLEGLLSSDKPALTFGEMIEACGDRSFGMVLILLSIPSALPIPATGISTPLGVIMFIIGAQMVYGRRILWLPERIHRVRVSKPLAGKILHGLARALEIFEWAIRPRYEWLHSRVGHAYVGLLVMLLSIMMQMPIPLTNTLPAMMIFFLALCLTEGDGLLGLFAGGLSALVITAYLAGFAAILFFGFEGLDHVLDYLTTQLAQ